jgi:hypothetical protein
VDNKILFMGLAALLLVVLLLIGGCVCAYYISKAWTSQPRELEQTPSLLPRSKPGSAPHVFSNPALRA